MTIPTHTQVTPVLYTHHNLRIDQQMMAFRIRSALNKNKGLDMKQANNREALATDLFKAMGPSRINEAEKKAFFNVLSKELRRSSVDLDNTTIRQITNLLKSKL